MKILHTSDWHLDAKLQQNSRAEEHERFFQWLRKTISLEKVDALVVAGDIFDSGTPSNAAYFRYTQFLRDLHLDVLSGKSQCRSIIVTAGNHDSPSFLQTSGPILKILGIHVVTQPAKDLREMLIPLKDTDGHTRCIVLAVPFLREIWLRELSHEKAENALPAPETPSVSPEIRVEERKNVGVGVEVENVGQKFNVPNGADASSRPNGSDVLNEWNDLPLFAGLELPEKPVSPTSSISQEASELAESRSASSSESASPETELSVPKGTLAESAHSGIRNFYRDLTQAALALREELLQQEAPEWFASQSSGSSEQKKQAFARRIPLLATGHLFTAQGKTLDEDGVRPIYVGTLEQFLVQDFPEELDYVALGHLHVPQIAGGMPHIRYSGSPLPMGFSEAGKPKKIVILETQNIEETLQEHTDGSADRNTDGNADAERSEFLKDAFQIRELDVPIFQRLEVLKGDFEEIRTAANSLPEEEPKIWVKAVFTGEKYDLGLREQIGELFQGLPHLKLVHFENLTARKNSGNTETDQTEDVLDLTEMELFERFLETRHSELSDDSIQRLQETFRELVAIFQEESASGTVNETEEEDFR